MQAQQRFRVGQFVSTWYDDGLHGTILYGVVLIAGPRTFDVRWESGLRNRRPQSCNLVQALRDSEQEAEARLACARTA